MSALRSQLQVTVRILCVIALVLVGFSHKLIASSPNASVDITAYALPDGTLPFLCIGGQSSDSDANAALFASCEFCRISTAVVLPDNIAVPERVSFVTTIPPATPARVESRKPAPATPATPRAPPFVV
ncbi:MAG: hypothetical protein KTR23_19385 [Rhodospirillales bacterium]|nr:hypothetical protein [Rhodospirillales bacterium]